jgi:hypothetical protein
MCFDGLASVLRPFQRLLCDQAFLKLSAHSCPMPKSTKHFTREVRRVRQISAWIKVKDRAVAECRVMDISNNGAKIVAATATVVPDRFQLAFFEGDQTRSCEVIWRHGKVFGVKFAR